MPDPVPPPPAPHEWDQAAWDRLEASLEEIRRTLDWVMSALANAIDHIIVLEGRRDDAEPPDLPPL